MKYNWGIEETYPAPTPWLFKPSLTTKHFGLWMPDSSKSYELKKQEKVQIVYFNERFKFIQNV